MCEEKETKPALNLDELEGLRGDGTARWYVVHTYSGHENKVKVNIEKLNHENEKRYYLNNLKKNLKINEIVFLYIFDLQIILLL